MTVFALLKEASAMSEIRYTAEPTGSSARPLRFDPALCVGCNRCVDACQIDD